MQIYVMKNLYKNILGAYKNKDKAIEIAYEIYKEQEKGYDTLTFIDFKRRELYRLYIVETQLYD